jgi:hypothetical protein
MRGMKQVLWKWSAWFSAWAALACLGYSLISTVCKVPACRLSWGTQGRIDLLVSDGVICIGYLPKIYQNRVGDEIFHTGYYSGEHAVNFLDIYYRCYPFGWSGPPLWLIKLRGYLLCLPFTVFSILCFWKLRRLKATKPPELQTSPHTTDSIQAKKFLRVDYRLWVAIAVILLFVVAFYFWVLIQNRTFARPSQQLIELRNDYDRKMADYLKARDEYDSQLDSAVNGDWDNADKVRRAKDKLQPALDRVLELEKISLDAWTKTSAQK